jgi:hypothetical protein
MKVVINRRFGGFDLSNTAIQLYIRKKNLGLYSNDDVNYYYVPVEEYNKQLESEELEYQKQRNGLPHNFSGYKSNDLCWSISLEYLVFAVLPSSSTTSTKQGSFLSILLKVVTIPDDMQYIINDFDGMESIHEKHRVWY